MIKHLLAAAFVLATAFPVHAAPGDPGDVLYIYGPPRNRVRLLAARVARQKIPRPIIIARWEPDARPAEATAADLQRWLDRRLP